MGGSSQGDPTVTGICLGGQEKEKIEKKKSEQSGFSMGI